MVTPSIGSVVLVSFPFSHFASGNLMRTSYARPGKLFSANTTLMRRIAGDLSRPKLTAVVDGVITILRPGA